MNWSTDLDEMLDLMDRVFRDLEQLMPNKPRLERLPSGMAFRFKEKDIRQAMILKLAHVQSSVRAAKLLLDNGFVQEQAILQRIIDEVNDDITFLFLAVANNEITDLHKKFLDAFWEEEIDSQQKRPMIRRQIREYLERRSMGAGFAEASKTLRNVYSGFVHGAYPQIMNMYGGNPPHFHTKGMLETQRMEEHANDLWNYMYRSFGSHILVAKALGMEKHVKILNEHRIKLEQNNEHRFGEIS